MDVPASSFVVPLLVVSVLDTKKPTLVREIAERVHRNHGCRITYQSIHYYLAKLRRKGVVAYIPNKGWVKKRLIAVSAREAMVKLRRKP